MRRLLLCACVLALPLGLAACGDDDEKTVIVNPPPSGGSTVVVPPSGSTKVCPQGQTVC